MERKWQPETRAIRTGHQRTEEGEHCEPIFTTSSFVFNNAAEAAARFSGAESGNLYSRFTNPTVAAFETRLAALEGGTRGIAFASGMAAIQACFMGLLSAGDHVLCSRSVFGTTTVLLSTILQRFGIESSFIALEDVSGWAAATRQNTRLYFLETPANPLTQLVDIRAVAEVAQAHKVLLVVDNVFATPALQQPLALGADIVLHSATKYLDGQGRCLGGAVVAKEAEVLDPVYAYLRSAGPTLSPFNAWVFLHGLSTLSVRMQQHCRNALALAEWLESQPTVRRVHYPGLASHPQHELACRQQQGFGGVLSFEVDGGRDKAWQVVDSTQWLSITANLGDVKTTIIHPATTTHGRLSDEQRMAAGITPGLVRISVGLENVTDIQADLEQGLSV